MSFCGFVENLPLRSPWLLLLAISQAALLNLGCSESNSPETTDATFLGSWGNSDLLDGQMNQPQSLAVEPTSGDILVADWGLTGFVHIFSAQGKFINRWAAQSPYSSMIFAHDGTLLITDTYHDRILNVRFDGSVIRSWGELGSEDGNFFQPKSIAVDAVSNVYVADTGNNRVQVFGPRGRFLRSWGGHGSSVGQFDTPTSIALDASGFIYVADSGNRRVQKFDANGLPIRDWPVQFQESPGSIGRGLVLDVDASGDVLVESEYEIQRFSQNGELIESWTGEGEPYEHTPLDIKVDAPRGKIYVLGVGSRGLQVYDSTHHLLKRIGELPASAPGQLFYPALVTVANDGSVLVKDTYGIQRFVQGAYHNGWKMSFLWGRPVFGMAATEEGQLLILVPGAVQKYSLNGEQLGGWLLGSIGFGVGMDVDETGRIWIVDSALQRVDAFSPTGQRVKYWGDPGRDPGQLFQPHSIAAREGLVAVCDAKSMQVFDEDGHLMRGLSTWTEGNDTYTSVKIRDHKLYAAGPKGTLSVFSLSSTAGIVGGALLGQLTPPPSVSFGDVAPDQNGDVLVLVPELGEVQRYRFQGLTSGVLTAPGPSVPD